MKGDVVLTAQNLTRHYSIDRGTFRSPAILKALDGASFTLVKGKTLTSWPSLTDDLKNAGANWVDEEVVVDGKLISSRKPDDIPAFNRKLIEALAA